MAILVTCVVAFSFLVEQIFKQKDELADRVKVIKEGATAGEAYQLRLSLSISYGQNYNQMHFLIAGFIQIGSIVAGVLIACLLPNYLQPLSIILFVFAFAYPLVTEPLQQCLMKMLPAQNSTHLASKAQLVYSQDYNITAGGLQKLHPFDSCKYRRVFQKLSASGLLGPDSTYRPQIVQRATLRKSMSFLHLLKLNFSVAISSYVELPVCFLPAFLLDFMVLRPMKRAAQGTVDATCIAIHKGWAVNLSGGYHHATANYGGGFCIYPDITMAVRQAQRHGLSKMLIVDLDAHQGNGYQRDLLQDQETTIIDFYNRNIYPGDSYAAKRITHLVGVNSATSDKAYLAELEDALDKYLPGRELVIYNAGTDILQGDPLGGLRISRQTIVKRDEIVFRKCLGLRVPVVMLLSGGYTQQSAQVIGQSLINLGQSKLVGFN